MDKNKKIFLWSASLGVLVLFLSVSSFSSDSEEMFRNPVEAIDEISLDEGVNDAAIGESIVDETQENDSDEVGTSPEEIAEKRYKEEIDSNTREITSKKYISENYHIAFKVPPEWVGKVSVVEQDLKMDFLYKGEHSFLSFIFVGKGKYEYDKDYYDAMYRKILEIDLYHLLYAPAGEHPLYDEKGSDDYKELSSFVDDVEEIVETVKIVK